MTKEKLLELTSQLNRYDVDDFNHFLTEFLDSNVCIPNGTEVKVPIWDNGYAVCNVENLVIKPSEPVYEYLWYDADGDTKWVTLDEAKEFERTWFWAKETGRMRQ